MKGDAKVIAHLNQTLKNELTAINQYFLHSRLLESWGLVKLAKHEYKESIEEMQHADLLIQRIILLDGHPNLQDLGKLYIGENVKEVIEGDRKLEIKGIDDLKAAIKDYEGASDYVSRDLFIKILTDEEGHLDHLDTMASMIETMGLPNFMLMQADVQGIEKE